MVMFMQQSAEWQKAASAKVAQTFNKIPTKWRLDSSDLKRAAERREIAGDFIHGFLAEAERLMVMTFANRLVDLIATRKLQAEDVTLAFCKTAAIAHQINNCLHEIFFNQAIERAKYLDDYMEKHGEAIGPLHGLPVSLKDQFHVKGNDTTMGYVGWIDTYEGNKNPDLVHKVNSQAVEELLSLGAVLFCKTSLPQTLLIGETKNNLIGQTLNPRNQHLSCGGSSGGEAALQALSGSPVGLGTDIGGSVRIPAAFCGVFSVKPTHNRLSYRDVANTNPGQDTYASSVGVLGATIEAIELVLRSLISKKPWLHDPNVVPIPWSPEIVKATLDRANVSNIHVRPLKLGIYWTDGVVTPHPPLLRALQIVVEAVRKRGHKVVEWKPPSQTTAKRVHLAFLKADGGHDIHRQLDLSGEPLIPELRRTFKLKDPIGLLEYQDLTIEGKAYCEEYSDYWNSTGDDEYGQMVDAVIMPVAPHAAVIPGKFYHTAYTEAINLMDFSAVVIPVTRADKRKDVADPLYKPLNEVDKMKWEAYEPDVYDGAPVGIQMIGRKYEEEKIWAIGKIVHDLLPDAGYEREPIAEL